MDTRIKQAELDTIDLKKFQEIRAVTAGKPEDGGIVLWSASLIGSFVGPNISVKPRNPSVLLIEMDDADNDEEREALQKKVLSRVSRRSGRSNASP